MNQPARQHDRAQRGVGAAVEHGVDVHRGQASVARHAGAMPDDRGMPLGRRQHVLDAVVDELHGPPRLTREQRRVPGDHRRVFFLAAKSAAGLGLDDADLVAGQPEQHRQRPVHVVGALQRAVDGDAAARLGHGDDAVRFDVQLLLMPDPVLALDDDVGGGETRARCRPCRWRSS